MSRAFLRNSALPAHRYIQAVERAAEILEIAGNSSEGLALSTISHASNLPRQTAYYLLRTLVHKGLLERRDGSGLYRLTPVMAGLRRKQDRWNRRVLIPAIPVAIKLARSTGAEVIVSQYTGGQALGRFRVPPGDSDAASTQHSWRICPYGTALVFQAFMDEGERRAFRMRNPFGDLDMEFWGSYRALDRFLCCVREEKCLTLFKDSIFRACCPLFDEPGRICGALSAIASPLSFAGAGQAMFRVVESVRRAAEDLTQALSGQHRGSEPSCPLDSPPGQQADRTGR
jgi:DNA-binding IclR family transcriptional regulator